MKKKKLLLLVLTLVVVVCAVTAGYWYWQNPKRVIGSALEQLSKVKTANFTADLAIVAPPASAQDTTPSDTINVVADGSFERHSGGLASIGASLNVDTKVQNLSDAINGEVRLLNNSAYLFLRDVPSFLTDLTPLKGQWIAFNRSSANQPAAVSQAGKQLFTEVVSQGKQKIGSESLIKYRAMATSDAVVQMMDGLSGLLGTQLTDQQISGLRDSVTSGSTLPVDFWITPLTHQLRRVGMTFTVPNGSNLTFLISFKDFNKTVGITIPSGARPIADVVKELQQQASPTPAVAGMQTQIPSADVSPTPVVSPVPPLGSGAPAPLNTVVPTP